MHAGGQLELGLQIEELGAITMTQAMTHAFYCYNTVKTALNQAAITCTRKKATALTAVILMTTMVPAYAAADLNAKQIIRASVAANEADWKAAPEYSFQEVDRTANGGSKTFEV